MAMHRSIGFWSVPLLVVAGMLGGSRLAATSVVTSAKSKPKPTPTPTATPPPTPAPGSPSIVLSPYADPWSQAQQRWWDIGSYQGTQGKGAKAITADFYNQYNGWHYTPNTNSPTPGLGYASPDFNYRGAGQPGGPTVTLTYDAAPGVPYFVGHIEARHLKPNFAYQMKLVGKPRYGPRGTGPFTQKLPFGPTVTVPDGGGEDWANSQLGHIGRWWNDSNASGNTNAVTNSVYASVYPRDTIYGYIFMGDFVTGADGSASVNFTGQNNYHITFQNWQSGKDVRMVQNGSPAQLTDQKGIKYFPIIGSPRTGISYAYGKTQPATKKPEKNGLKNVYLWYQYESSMTPGRPRTVTLPPGRYRCRVMLTEESFHNNYGATNSPWGGKWQTVLITEDFASDAQGQTSYDANGYATPDMAASNDVVFDIRDANGNLVPPPNAPEGLTARWGADTATVALAWSQIPAPDANTYFNIKRSESSGGPYLTVAGGVNTGDTNYSDETVSPGKSYFYVVSTVHCGVEGPNSAEVSPTQPAAFNRSTRHQS